MPHVAIICKRFKTHTLIKSDNHRVWYHRICALNVALNFANMVTYFWTLITNQTLFAATNTRNRCNFADLFTFYRKAIELPLLTLSDSQGGNTIFTHDSSSERNDNVCCKRLYNT